MVLKGKSSPTLTQSMSVDELTWLGLRGIALMMSPVGREEEVASHGYFILTSYIGLKEIDQRQNVNSVSQKYLHVFTHIVDSTG